LTLVFMFPGQSSRYPGMLDKLVELHPPNGELLERSSDLLGRDLRAQYKIGGGGDMDMDRGDSPEGDGFARNVDVQVGVFLANHMFMTALEARGIEAELSMGLSLGEWNHLVHIGALSFEDALRGVEQRGRCYDQGPRGWMAAIHPIDADSLREVVGRAGKYGVLEIVNLNSPRQHVVAGERAAVEAAAAQAEDEHYAEAHIIERNVPMHSSLFAPVGARFAEILRGLEFAAPRRPYMPNRLARFVPAPSPATFVELLSTHVHAPVLWRESLEHVVAAHPEAVFVEVGPMAVLHNLMHRKWLRNRKFRCDSRDDIHAHFEATVAALSSLQAAEKQSVCTPS